MSTNTYEKEPTLAELSALNFRQIMKAMAYPGRLFSGLSLNSPSLPCVTDSAQQIAATLMSHETTLCVHNIELSDACKQWIQFSLRSELAPITRADFVILNDTDLEQIELDSLMLGSATSPEKSVTLLVNVSAKLSASVESAQRPISLRGPGVNPKAAPPMLNLDSVPTQFFENRAALAPLFPMGFDVYFCDDENFVAMPRTTTASW